MKIITDKITREELRKRAEFSFGDMVKAVVDVTRGIEAAALNMKISGIRF